MAHSTAAATLSIVLIVMQGCAMTNATTHNASSVTLTEIPAADPVLDHYIAWVPLKQAQTAGVARAMTHISLGNAREQVAKELCGDHRVIKQAVTDSVGPVQALAPAMAGGYPAWYYRISQSPGPAGCADTDSQLFREAIGSKLPVWLDLHTASKQPE
jgi:hypothetical protein